MWNKISLIFKDADLRRKFLFLFGFLAAFRFLASIPIPGIDPERLNAFLSGSQLFGLLNIFSGEAGKQKFNQYSRLLTLPLALVQGFGLITLLERQGVLSLSAPEKLGNMLIVAAGSVLLMWIGELISEYSIGNGVSIMIFAGIVSSVPLSIGQTLLSFDQSQLPIIFALLILLFPQMIASFLSSSTNVFIKELSSFALGIIANQLVYGLLYFVLVVLFTYFYTSVTFDPEAISNNLQRGGAFVPGIRPGPSTAGFLYKIVSR